jgi:serine/threonine-protein kinase
VYLAELPGGTERVAVKLLRRELADDPDLLRRFRLEAVVTKSLGVPQVVPTYDFGQLEAGTHYLTMEFVEGTGLDQILASGRKLKVDETVWIARQVLAALAAAHDRGVIHRDLKPGNLLLSRDAAGRPLLRILDFGFARVVADALSGPRRLTQGHVILGTPCYMAPEQARGSREVDFRADLYSLGVILYRALAGVPPFEGATSLEILQKQQDEKPQPPSAHRPDVPTDLERVILRLLQKDPAGRYANSHAVLADLRNAFPPTGEEPCPAPATSPAASRSELLRQVGRHVLGTRSIPALPEPAAVRRLLWFAVGAGVLILAAVVVLVMLNG